MKNKKYSYTIIAVVVAIVIVALQLRHEKISSYSQVDRVAKIDPDYSGIAIPPNIAPLNFVVKENAVKYCVKISCKQGDTIVVQSRKPGIEIPFDKWKKLLQTNRGGTLTIDIYAKTQNGNWQKFNSITNKISTYDIDGFLVYRKILGYQAIPDMSIRQRSLATFDDKIVLSNSTLFTSKLSCINCHSFCNYKANDMIIHMRGSDQGMLLVQNKKVVKIDTRTKFNKTPASYAAWHPSGKLIAFAVMKVNQVLHSVEDPRVVFDESSDIIIYNVETNSVSSYPSIADPKRLETLPEWSPDGKYLYFCSAAQPEKIDEAFYAHLQFKEIKYDIMRIPFDIATGKWGALDTVLLSQTTKMSNVQPKISPDGRYLLFVTTPYSYFAGYNDSSDLCMMDLSTRIYKRLDNVNSKFAESFHSWSSNGKWFVFNSRRRDGICGSPYFSFVDTDGSVSKPFILPQKDPAFYDTYLKSFNVPVLVSEPVNVDWREISKAANNTKAEKIAQLDSKVNIDALSGATVKGQGNGGTP